MTSKHMQRQSSSAAIQTPQKPIQTQQKANSNLHEAPQQRKVRQVAQEAQRSGLGACDTRTNNMIIVICRRLRRIWHTCAYASVFVLTNGSQAQANADRVSPAAVQRKQPHNFLPAVQCLTCRQRVLKQQRCQRWRRCAVQRLNGRNAQATDCHFNSDYNIHTRV